MVHHRQRIVDGVHVQPGEVSPGAADRIEGPALAAREQLGAAELLAHEFLRGLDQRAPGQVLQPQAAERQRDAVADRHAVDVDQLEAAAAEVAGNAVGRMEAGDDAERGVMRLFAAGQDADRGAAGFLGRGG